MATNPSPPPTEPDVGVHVYIRVTGPAEDRTRFLSDLEGVALEEFFAVHSPLPEEAGADPEDYWDAAGVTWAALDPNPGIGPHLELVTYPVPPFEWLCEVSFGFPALTFTAVYDNPSAEDGEARFAFKAGEPLEEWWF